MCCWEMGNWVEVLWYVKMCMSGKSIPILLTCLLLQNCLSFPAVYRKIFPSGPFIRQGFNLTLFLICRRYREFFYLLCYNTFKNPVLIEMEGPLKRCYISHWATRKHYNTSWILANSLKFLWKEQEKVKSHGYLMQWVKYSTLMFLILGGGRVRLNVS